MSCLPVAVTIALCENEDDSTIRLIVNPRIEVEKIADALMTFVFDSADQNLLSTYTHGKITASRLEKSLKLAKEASQKTIDFFRDSISKKLSADIR